MGLLGCDRAGGLVLRWAMWGCALWLWVGIDVGLWVVRLLLCVEKETKNNCGKRYECAAVLPHVFTMSEI